MMDTEKKDWRRDDHATRIDLRIPNEIYDRVVKLAVERGERVNPKSGQVRLTATLNHLIETGLNTLSDSYQTPSDNIRLSSDNIGLETLVKKLQDDYQTLSCRLSIVESSDINQTSSDFVGLQQDIIRLDSQYRELSDNVRELETHTNKQLEAMRCELKQSESDRVDDSNGDAIDEKLARLLRKFKELSGSDRLELVELLKDGVSPHDRDLGLTRILNWKDGKSPKSMMEDASRWKKLLRLGLLTVDETTD